MYQLQNVLLHRAILSRGWHSFLPLRTAMSRILILSNRLPVKLSEGTDGPVYKPSEGGLATGLASVYKQGDNLWIGWPGAEVAPESQAGIVADFAPLNLFPVFLSKEEIEDYYEGFSNETLWPLFHYFPSYATYVPRHYEAYERVNRRFADAVLQNMQPGDTVWIHDYQLLLVPQMVRDAVPDATIGFFNHIPFPSYELFRLLPWRKEILRGMLGADLIGFHTYDDVRHFLSAASRILGIPAVANELALERRTAVVDAFPISIDYKKYRALAEDPTTRRTERKVHALMNGTRTILAIDRLDYSKGIPERLRAYDILLERYPEVLRNKVTFIQLVVPSRDAVPKYKQLKDEIAQLVGEINGRHGRLGWQPVQHFYRSFPERMLSALYRAADVALVTPLRDGMNLVSKEYVASRTDGKGVLVLSEMAGASRELAEAVTVNPHDIWQVAESIHAALTMPEAEQRRRMSALQATVQRFDIHHWVHNFRAKLAEVKQWQARAAHKAITPANTEVITDAYRRAARRLILLDYDGTLVGFQKVPSAAGPDKRLLRLLDDLCADERNRVFITSGRDYATLEAWLGELPLGMIAEHGAWTRDDAGRWTHRPELTDVWKSEIRAVMEVYADRTPGALIEEKSYSLAWHYRRADADLGETRARALAEDIAHFVAARGLSVLMGNKVVEVKMQSVNKGTAARTLLEAHPADFVLAIGDDRTDEDTFKALPSTAFSIKVGTAAESDARFMVEDYEAVRALLRALLQPVEEGAEHAALPGISGEAA